MFVPKSPYGQFYFQKSPTSILKKDLVRTAPHPIPKASAANKFSKNTCKAFDYKLNLGWMKNIDFGPIMERY